LNGTIRRIKATSKHGLSFEQAVGIFDGFKFDWIDDSYAHDEIREISIGKLGDAAVIVVVHTDRDGVCRIISARPALKKERKKYDEEIQKAFDA